MITDVFRHEHPDTRPAKVWWAQVMDKMGKTPKLIGSRGNCAICGTYFESNKAGKLTCSPECGYQLKLQKDHERRAALPKKYHNTCIMCGVTFGTNILARKTCSNKCRVAWAKVRYRNLN